MTLLETFRVVVGFVLVMFVPGYAATWALFPNDREIDLIERIALAIGLSISLVVLSIYVLNVALDMRINTTNSLLVILAITFLCTGIYFLRAEKKGLESKPAKPRETKHSAKKPKKRKPKKSELK